MMSSSSDELLRGGVEPAIDVRNLQVIRGKRIALENMSVQIASNNQQSVPTVTENKVTEVDKAGTEGALGEEHTKPVEQPELADWAKCIVDTRNAMAGIPTPPGQVWKA